MAVLVPLGYKGAVTLEAELTRRVLALKEAGLWREERSRQVETREVDRVPWLELTSNDYLGLAQGGVSRETLMATVGKNLGAGCSRAVSDASDESRALESLLADWVGLEASLVFTSAYSANVGVLPAVATTGDLLISDELNHASIVDGCRLSRASVEVVGHLDLAAVERRLKAFQGPGRCWVVTESYFSMDANCPDLVALHGLCQEFGAALMVDESHALGVFGDKGAGLCREVGVVPDLIIGGLGKAVGAQGGFVACSDLMRSWLWNRARTHFFSTGMSPLLASLVIRAVRRVIGAEAERVRLRTLTGILAGRLAGTLCKMPVGRTGPVFPIVLGEPGRTLEVAKALAERGLTVQAIRPPTVVEGAARLRVSLRASLSDDEVKDLAEELVAQVRGALGNVSRETVNSRPVRNEANRDPAPGKCQTTERWVVLGCGTGIGKTYVARGLLANLREQGRSCAGLKPIESGLRPSASAPENQMSDAEALESASFQAKLPSPHPLYAFKEPLTPARAARLEARKISLMVIREWAAKARPVSREPNQVGVEPFAEVIETAGGVFSPIGDDASNFDLAVALGRSTWVLVAVDRLGVLNDLVATIRAMRAEGREPDWIVLTAPENEDASTGTNAEELLRFAEFSRYSLRLIHLPRDQVRPLCAMLDSLSHA